MGGRGRGRTAAVARRRRKIEAHACGIMIRSFNRVPYFVRDFNVVSESELQYQIE